MEIAYDDEGNEAEIKTNNDDGTDSFGRLLECKLRFRWKNMTNGVKAGKFQGFVKIIVPSLAIGYCTQITTRSRCISRPGHFNGDFTGIWIWIHMGIWCYQ